MGAGAGAAAAVGGALVCEGAGAVLDVLAGGGAAAFGATPGAGRTAAEGPLTESLEPALGEGGTGAPAEAVGELAGVEDALLLPLPGPLPSAFFTRRVTIGFTNSP